MRLVVAFFLMAFAGSTAQAQAPFGPASRPAFSPYLNLLRNGNPTFQNYYGLVRPQIQASQSIQSLQGQLQNTNALIASNATGTDGSALPVTGQTFGYMNHLGYFLNNGSGGGIGGGGVGGMGGNAVGNGGAGFGGRQNTGNIGGGARVGNVGGGARTGNVGGGARTGNVGGRR